MLAEEFCSRLDQFFLQLPKDFRYAVEVRNPGLLGMLYSLMLSRHGVAHVYNHWSSMPFLADQHTTGVHSRVYCATASYAVGNVLFGGEETSRAVYEDRGGATADGRETVQLIRQAIGMGRHAYVLVDNRAEEKARLTVAGLVGILKG